MELIEALWTTYGTTRGQKIERVPNLRHSFENFEVPTRFELV